MVSYDNFDNFQLQSVLSLSGGHYLISRGYNSGELYLFCPYGYPVNSNNQDLLFSNDFGVSWNILNNFNFNTAITPEDWGIVGGRQPGELYVYATYYFDMGSSAQIYIFHSTDYGGTFTKYHPWGFGNEPLVPHFNCLPDSGNSPLEVQFFNNSIGEITSWEWDIDDDGTADYFEQNPVHTYADSGSYNVKLTVTGEEGSFSIVRNNAVYVTNEVSADDNYELSIMNYELQNYPNPFNPTTTIDFSIHNDSNIDLSIFNIKGQKIKTLANNDFTKGNHSIVWNGANDSGNSVSSGIYFYSLNINGKTEAVKKCLLLK